MTDWIYFDKNTLYSAQEHVKNTTTTTGEKTITLDLAVIEHKEKTSVF